MVDYFGQILIGANAKAIESMQANGVEVIELPEAERAQLIKRGSAYVDAWIETANATGVDGAAVLDEYRALLVKCADLRETQGYPWAN